MGIKVKTASVPNSRGGFALLIVLIFSALILFSLAAALDWSTSRTNSAQRLSEYFRTQSAAEASAAKAATSMSRDFQNYGQPQVRLNLDTYRALVPGTNENSDWCYFKFSDNSGNVNKLGLTEAMSWQYTNLTSAFTGIQGYTANYQITSLAQEVNTTTPLAVAIQQNFQICSIPLFQFSVFYDPDLEINPSTAMTIAGRVHCNGTIYAQPSRTVEFSGGVTAAGDILNLKRPQDPTTRSGGSLTFDSTHVPNFKSLHLSMDSTNRSASAHFMIEVPPAKELATSQTGQQRYYNKADMIIVLTDTTTKAFSGAYNNFATVIPWSKVAAFVNTNVYVFDKRENRYARVTDINISTFNANYAYLTSVLGRNVHTLYVADQRTTPLNTFNAWRLNNATILPTNGLTVATLNPLYVFGNYNIPVSTKVKGVTTTTPVVPASLAADAITILSSYWLDSYSTASLYYRPAYSTTINASLLAGIVPSGGGYYSGGLENLPRMLEDWSNDTLTITGSMAVLYLSVTANSPWGTTSDIYNPPTRSWNFTHDFSLTNSLPPSTPEIRVFTKDKPVTVAAKLPK